MLAGYVVLDGFDIGVGILHLWMTRIAAQRRLLRSMARYWTEMKCGFSPVVALFTSPFPLYTPRASGDFICH